MMDKPSRIVVLGAGYGGVLTAKKLARRLKGRSDIEIILIDRNGFHTMLTELHEVAAGRVPEQSVRIELKTIFEGRAVTVIQDEISGIDFESRTLVSASETYNYDWLVLGTGSKPTFFGIKGARENCFQLWSYTDAVKLKAHITGQFRKAENERDSEIRRGLLRFVVVGCGFTGVEMVGELAEWKPRLCREFRIDPDEVDVIAVDVLPSVLPLFPEALIKKTEKRLGRLGVQVLTGTSVEEVGPDFAVLAGRGTLKTSTVIWTAGIEGSTLAGSLSLPKEGRNRVLTNEFLQSVQDSRVYVVGDNIFTLTGAEKKPVPQMVENAEHSSSLVAQNIIASMERQPLKIYKPTFHGAMVSVGGRYCVAHLGLPGRFFSLSGFPAMGVKHFINLVYFMQVAGISKCWSYMKHEFFKVPDRRSLIGGHFAKASPNFWLVPLRVFMGFKWSMEAVGKLPQIISEPSRIFLIPPPPALADATSAATASGPAPGGAAEAAGATSQFGQPLPVPEFVSGLTAKIMDILFYTQDGGYTVLAQLFQGAIVLSELALGLCLIAGLFTFPASVAAIALCMMFWASGTSGHEILWYIAASFATMGGSGSVFGLDYYVLPWIKAHWNRIPIIRRWYLFID